MLSDDTTGRPHAPPRLRAATLRLSWQRPVVLTLALLLLFTVGRLHELVPVLMRLRPALLLTGLALGLAILQPGALAGAPALRSWPARVVLALGVHACLGAPFGLSLGASAATILEVFSKVVLVTLLLMLSMSEAHDVAMLVRAYVVGAALLCIRAIQSGTTVAYGSYVARLDDSAPAMFDPNDVGVILTVAIPLALLTLRTGGWIWRTVSLASVALMAWTMALAGSRGGFLGLALLGLMLLLSAPGTTMRSRFAALGILAAALVAAAPEGYWKQMSTIFAPTEDYNWTADNGRVEIAKRGLGYMAARPVFGVGIGNFGRAECSISSLAKEYVYGDNLLCAAPHNSFVQAGAELGVPGLALWCSLIVGGIAASRRLRRRLPREWAQGTAEQRFLLDMATYLPMSLAGFAVTAFFVSFAWYDILYILAAFVTGLSVASARALRAAPPGAASPAAPPEDAGIRYRPAVLRRV
jgi:O-antigen ligase